jgi:hypothetical protein
MQCVCVWGVGGEGILWQYLSTVFAFNCVIVHPCQVVAGMLHISPIKEMETLRHNVSTVMMTGPSARKLITSDNHVEVRLNCTLHVSSDQVSDHRVIRSNGKIADGGNVSVEVLATPDAEQWARYGFDIGAKHFFIESRGFKTTSSRSQTPYVHTLSWKHPPTPRNVPMLDAT